jgi:hypothetical protein
MHESENSPQEHRIGKMSVRLDIPRREWHRRKATTACVW